MQLPKLPILYLLALMLTWGCWCASGTEAQEYSSRKGYSKRGANGAIEGAGSKAVQAIRVDKNLGRSWPASFVIQQEDANLSTPKPTDSSLELQSTLELQSSETADADSSESGESEQASQFNASRQELDDDGDPDELDPDFEPDQLPTRPMFGNWPKKGIRGITIDIRETNSNAPEDLSQQLLDSNPSDWTQFHPQQKVFAWAAPDIRYQPLYFEDVALERYGTTAGPYHQSLISAFYFFTDFVLLPHKFRHDCPSSCDHPLGFCRPGNTTPYSLQRHYFGRPRSR